MHANEGALTAIARDLRPRPAALTAVPLLAAATFLAGFGVAELTHVRALGGLVLLAGGALCARAALSAAGAGATIALLAVALALFVASHPLGDAIGAWPAVLVAASTVAGVAALLLHRAARA